VMLDDGSALASWIEQVEGAAEFRARHVGPEGPRGEPVRIASLPATRASGYPRMVRAGDRLIFAWTDAGDVTQVRTATGRLDRP